MEVLRRVRRELPRTRVLIFSGDSNRALLQEALREAPRAYVERDAGLENPARRAGRGLPRRQLFRARRGRRSARSARRRRPPAVSPHASFKPCR